MSDQVKVVYIVSKEPTWLSVRCPVPTYEERVRPLAHHRLSELGTLGPRRRPCHCTTHPKLHSMSSWRTTLCTWSAVVEFREAPCAPGAARRASRVMDVLLLLLLLTTLAHGQCTVDKDIREALKKWHFLGIFPKPVPPPHNGRTVAPEAILFESPCRAHPET